MLARIGSYLAALAMAAALSLGTGIGAANAELIAKVDLSQQRMKVFVDGKHKYTWAVSTGRKGWPTYVGNFTPYAMKPFHYSKKWNMSLPHTIWVHKSMAIHGTDRTSRLGRPASHGCIRLSPGNAKRFYSLVQSYGLWSTSVVVTK